MKLKKLFNGKNQDSTTEISGSFGGEAPGESLLGDDSTRDDSGKWESWSFRNKSDADRGRSDDRLVSRRSSSERPSLRKRSKSEVSKRLKKLEGAFGMKPTKKSGGSKSVGGAFKGNSSEVRSKIDSLAMERSDSETKMSGFDSLFDQTASERNERTSFSTSKPTKKLRGGRRTPATNENGNGDSGAPRRSRSSSVRRIRSKSAISSDSERKRSSSKMRSRSKSKPRGSSKTRSRSKSKSRDSSKPRSSSKVRSKSKVRSSSKGRSKSIRELPEAVSTEDRFSVSTSVSTLTTKDSKKKKKKTEKEKKKKGKDDNDSSEVSSVPSKVDTSDSDSATMTSNGKKKKAKKPKQSKSVSKFPQLPAEDFGDGLQGLAEEFRRSKEKEAADYEIKDSQIAQQQEEILKLQQQLSTALQKQLTMSEEHIKEKNEFMNVSRDLERVKAELAESREERQEAMDVLKDRDQIIEEDKSRIENLEQAIDKQLGKEEELMKNVQQSEEEIENLLVEIQKFESKLENGDAGDGGASFVELRNVKKDLTDREEEIASQKFKIEQLEKDLQESITVPQLQIEELDQENKALQGRLKGERLEYTSKLSAKDDVIQNLRTELANYTASPDAQDLQSALQKLAEAREDATTVRESLAAAVTKIETLEGEKEDFMEEFNLLKENNVFMEKTVKELTEKADGLAKKVLEWTEKTYDWKERAETAERKLEEGNVDKEKAGSETGDSAGPQTMFLQAAMDKGKKGNSNRGSWGILNKFASENQEESAEQVRVRVLEDQNIEYEAKIAQLSSDIVKMQTGHKEELYTTKKKIAQLEGENEALTLQNSTLQELTEE